MDFRLTGVVGGVLRVWKIPEGESRVGRDSNLEISIGDLSVSRKHAVLRRTGDVVLVEDTHSHNGTLVNGARTEGAPLHTEDRIAFGSVVLRFMECEVPVSPALTDHERLTSAITLQWRDLHAVESTTSSASASMLHALSDMGEFLARRQSQEEVYELSLEWVERLLPFHRACLLLLNPDGQAEVRASRFKSRGANAGRLVLSQTMVQAVIRNRAALLVRDAQSDDRFNLSMSVVTARIRSALVAPLFDNTRVIGVLYVDTSDAHEPYDEDQLRRLALLANILAVKITNGRLIEAERDKERLRLEMETAARIQRALLPRSLTAPAGYEMDARLVPSTEVGGDLYDVLPLPGRRKLIVVGDVCGHGVGAALLMANALAAVRALAGLTDDPVDLVSRLHSQVRRSTVAGSYVTLFAAVLDPTQHRLTFVNAGHEFPALIRAGEPPLRLVATGPPVGMLPDVKYESQSIDFPVGALLGIWTDGISEAHAAGPSSAGPPAFFGVAEPMDGLLAKLQNLPLAAIAGEVFSTLDRFLEGRNAPDDATLFLLRRIE